MMDSGDKVVLPGSPSNGQHGGARPPEAPAMKWLSTRAVAILTSAP